MARVSRVSCLISYETAYTLLLASFVTASQPAWSEDSLATAKLLPNGVFGFLEPGQLFPKRSGQGRNGDRRVYAPDIQFPVKLEPGAPHPLPSSMVFSYGGGQSPPDDTDESDPRNLMGPVRDNFCESRGNTFKTPFCPGRTRAHQGCDIRAKPKADVVAVVDGELRADSQRGTLNLVAASGLTFVYRHLTESSVSAALARGRRVAKGDVIGEVWKTAPYATHFHLHFEIRADTVVNNELVSFTPLPCATSLIAALAREHRIPLQMSGPSLGPNPNHEMSYRQLMEGTHALHGRPVPPPAPSAPNPPASGPIPKSELTRNFLALTVYPKDGAPPAPHPYIVTYPGFLPNEKVIDHRGGWIYSFATNEAGVAASWNWLRNRATHVLVPMKPTPRELSYSMAGVHPDHCTAGFNPTPEGQRAEGDDIWTLCQRVREYVKAYAGWQGALPLSRHYFTGSVPALDERIDMSNGDTAWSWMRTMYHHESGRTPIIDRLVFDRGVNFANDYIASVSGGPPFKGVAFYASPCNFSQPGCTGGPSRPVPPPPSVRPVPTSPDIGDDLVGLRAQVARLTTDLAAQRGLIAELQGVIRAKDRRIADLERGTSGASSSHSRPQRPRYRPLW